ncbi:hypothetical protein HDU97_004137 [Phlyctochytrium planicorne]|nr:hypothetical protein HDU97_004137 [Phlyctochytrium planicorne]
MAYDVHGTWDSTIGANTPNNEIFQSIDSMIAQGFTKEKIVLGLAFYGRSYKLKSPSTCNGLGCAFTSGGPVASCSQSSGIMFPSEIDALKSSASKSGTDAITGTSWFITSSGDFVTYDSVSDMQKKYSIAKDKCLGGVMAWSIDSDTTLKLTTW